MWKRWIRREGERDERNDDCWTSVDRWERGYLKWYHQPTNQEPQRPERDDTYLFSTTRIYFISKIPCRHILSGLLNFHLGNNSRVSSSGWWRQRAVLSTTVCYLHSIMVLILRQQQQQQNNISSGNSIIKEFIVRSRSAHRRLSTAIYIVGEEERLSSSDTFIHSIPLWSGFMSTEVWSLT